MIRKAKVKRPYTLQTSRQMNPDVTGSKKKGEKVNRSAKDRRDPIGEMNTDLAVDDEPTVLGGVVRRDLGQGVDLRIAPHLSLSPSHKLDLRRGEYKAEDGSEEGDGEGLVDTAVGEHTSLVISINMTIDWFSLEIQTYLPKRYPTNPHLR